MDFVSTANVFWLKSVQFRRMQNIMKCLTIFNCCRSSIGYYIQAIDVQLDSFNLMPYGRSVARGQRTRLVDSSRTQLTLVNCVISGQICWLYITNALFTLCVLCSVCVVKSMETFLKCKFLVMELLGNNFWISSL